MAQEVRSANAGGDIPRLKPNQIIECRGGIWRFIREDRGLWELELLRQGSHYSEFPVKVWAIPQLEKSTLRVLKSHEAYTPYPSTENQRNAKYYKPLLTLRKNSALEDRNNSKEPITAKQCAIEIKPWQFEPWRRIVDALPFPRILLADDVGLGKTTEAAIILTELTRRKRAERVLIIAPQHLSEKWQDELYERFGLAFEIYNRTTRERLNEKGVKNPWQVVERVIVSRDFVKRWENLKPLENVKWDVIIIDECHHFVKDLNQSQKRLRELAEKIVYNSPGLILLSATPFTGDKEQFNSLIQLIDPKFYDRTAQSKWNPNDPCIVRRNKNFLSKNENETFNDREIHHHEINMEDLSKDEVTAIAYIAKDLLISRGRKDRQHWDMLLEEVVKKRLSSSWAAFYETVSGDKKLSKWFTDETRNAVKKLVEKHDSSKLRTLASVIKTKIFKEDPKSKIVIFTEAIPTMEYIQEYLIKALSLNQHELAVLDGNTPREERLKIEDNFSNPSSQLKVLVATDTISEGKDLQHACNHLIHFELPWSFVKIEQRNGRIDRLGQKKVPHIHNIIFNTQITPDQRVIKRLLEKVEKASKSIGSVNQIIEIIGEINLSGEQNLDEVEKQIEKRINSIQGQNDEFGFSFANFTAQSTSPVVEQSNEDKISQFQIMVETVEGKMVPNGNAPHEYQLSLPSGWTISGLDAVGEESYPSEEKPWRITFNPERYLEYERDRREHGESRTPLHFIGPVHPIYLQVETRFRLGLERGGFPIFHVTGGIFPEIILAELTVRSKTSRIVAQKIVAIELNTFKEVDFSLLGEFKSTTKPVSLPDKDKWNKLEDVLSSLCKKYISTLKTSYDTHLEKYLVEQQSLEKEAQKNSKVYGVQERKEWLEDFWMIDTESVQFQVTALLVNEGRR